MQSLPLQAIPNQRFSVVLDGNQWDISIKTVIDSVAVTLILNGTMLIENLRAVANMRIIPARYQETGNFAIITQNQEVPDYAAFGTTQTLVYITQAELDAERAPDDTPIITAADFDPIASLPLRFAPQGYTLAP